MHLTWHQQLKDLAFHLFYQKDTNLCINCLSPCNFLNIYLLIEIIIIIYNFHDLLGKMQLNANGTGLVSSHYV